MEIFITILAELINIQNRYVVKIQFLQQYLWRSGDLEDILKKDIAKGATRFLFRAPDQ